MPWDSDNLWSTFAAYFFVLHIPSSFGGLSITANILHQSVLDPLTMAVSALVLQTTETVGTIALLHYTAKPQYRFPKFITEMLNSERRNWIQASALGIGFLIGLVWLTSALADRLVGPKDVNNPILKDIILYSPSSKSACFILYCLIAPLLEEIVYRGFLLTSLASKTNWWQAVIISSCVFSIAHFSEMHEVGEQQGDENVNMGAEDVNKGAKGLETAKGEANKSSNAEPNKGSGGRCMGSRCGTRGAGRTHLVGTGGILEVLLSQDVDLMLKQLESLLVGKYDHKAATCTILEHLSRGE